MFLSILYLTEILLEVNLRSTCFKYSGNYDKQVDGQVSDQLVNAILKKNIFKVGFS